MRARWLVTLFVMVFVTVFVMLFVTVCTWLLVEFHLVAERVRAGVTGKSTPSGADVNKAWGGAGDAGTDGSWAWVCVHTDGQAPARLIEIEGQRPPDAARRVAVVSDQRCLHRAFNLPQVPEETLSQLVRTQVEAALPGEAIKRLQWAWARPSAVWVMAIATDAITTRDPASASGNAPASAQENAPGSVAGGAAVAENAGGQPGKDAAVNKQAESGGADPGTDPLVHARHGHVSESMAFGAWLTRPGVDWSASGRPGDTVWVLWAAGQARVLWLTAGVLSGAAVVDLPWADPADADAEAIAAAIASGIESCFASAGGDAERAPAGFALSILAAGTDGKLLDLRDHATLGDVLPEVARRSGAAAAERSLVAEAAGDRLGRPVSTLYAGGAAVLALPQALPEGRTRAWPVIGLSDAGQAAETLRASTRRRWRYIAVAAVWVVLALGLLIRQDISDAGRLEQAVAEAGVTAADESALQRRQALYRYLEKQGPTPLAVVDEIGRVTKGYMIESLSFEAGGQIRLTGQKRQQRDIDALVAALANARTLDQVQLKSQRRQGRETEFEILATPRTPFFEPWVALPEPPVEQKVKQQQEGGNPR